MLLLIWKLLWPTLAGIVLAVTAWSVLRRSARLLLVGRAPTAVMVGTASLVTVGYPFLVVAVLLIGAPYQEWPAIADARFALPLVLGLLVLILLGAVRPSPSPGAASGALLAPRSWRSFLSSWWIGAFLAVLGLIVALSLAAGFASQPNDAGEYVLYEISFDSSSAMLMPIYGWHLSLVPLALLVPLCAATWWTLHRIARPPLAAEHTADAVDRRLRSANVLRVTLGALLLHLTVILHSLADTSRATLSVSPTEDVTFSGGTPFSALTGTLDVLALLAGILGLALWVFTMLTAVPAPSASRSRRAPVSS
ncbi:MAG: hypothetical protein L0H39_02815 [Brachybacterium sp.]|nr:hypothetical protein [Brachybacterium sp.]